MIPFDAILKAGAGFTNLDVQTTQNISSPNRENFHFLSNEMNSKTLESERFSGNHPHGVCADTCWSD